MGPETLDVDGRDPETVEKMRGLYTGGLVMPDEYPEELEIGAEPLTPLEKELIKRMMDRVDTEIRGLCTDNIIVDDPIIHDHYSFEGAPGIDWTKDQTAPIINKIKKKLKAPKLAARKKGKEARKARRKNR